VEQIIRIGMDTSKHVFQLHGVNAAEVPILRKKLRRKEMVAFFEKLAPTVIAIEACGASHHWARLLQSFGHTVKLIPAQLVIDPAWVVLKIAASAPACLDGTRRHA
jgi:transposase